MAGTQIGLPRASWRKVGTTSSHHGPYGLGYTRPTMGGTEGSEVVRRSESLKAILSSDCRLQFAYMKPESLVIAGQLHRGEYVPEPCTHRPSSHPNWSHPKSQPQPSREERAEGEAGKGD